MERRTFGKRWLKFGYLLEAAMKKLKDNEKLEAIADWIDNQNNVTFWQNKPSEDAVCDIVNDLRRIAAEISERRTSTNKPMPKCLCSIIDFHYHHGNKHVELLTDSRCPEHGKWA